MKKFLLFLLIFSLTTKSYSQVGVGTITPAASAVLDITSTTKGVLVPWITTNAEVITTNVQVPVGNTYRLYEYKWWAMEVGSNKIIFISIERKL